MQKVKMKRTKMDKFLYKFEIVRLLIAVVIAFGVSFGILAMFTPHPVQAIVDLIIGPLTSVRRFSTVIEKAIPLTFAGLAVSVMFRANQFNLAAEGALYFGSLVAATIAIFMGGHPIFVTIVAILSAGVVGSIITAIPGYLKVKWNVSELVVSIMLNTIILYFGTYLFNHYIRDINSAYAASYPFRDGVGLPVLLKNTRLHLGIVIVAIFVIAVNFFINKTKWGYKIKVTGNNEEFAKSVGMNTPRIIMLAQLVGGFVAGIGGGVEMLGLYTRFQWMALPGFGFDGVVLNIIAKGNPKFIPLAAIFVSYIRIGADYMYRQSGVAPEIVAIIEGILIILIAANAFLAKWRHKMTVDISTRELNKEVA